MSLSSRDYASDSNKQALQYKHKYDKRAEIKLHSHPVLCLRLALLRVVASSTGHCDHMQLFSSVALRSESGFVYTSRRCSCSSSRFLVLGDIYGTACARCVGL